MTERILALFRSRRKPVPDAVFADRLAIARYRVRVLGDRERAMNEWRRGYEIRTRRAA